VDIFTQDADLSFSNAFDQLTEGRLKTAHTQGLHAKASWVSSGDHEYTGLFDTGSDNVLIRFSETTNLTSESTGLLPALAVKVMVDYKSSVNIVAMPSFWSTGSWNFFEYGFKTRVEPFTKADEFYEWSTVRLKLAEGSAFPYVCGYGHFGDRYEDGSMLTDLGETVSIPYEIEF